MGGQGSGRYPMGSGKKPKKKKIERRGRKKGEVRIGAGRQPLGDKKRVPLNVTVAPATKRLLQSLVESEGISEGMAVDMLAEPYTLTDEELATYLNKHSKPAESPSEPVQGNLF